MQPEQDAFPTDELPISPARLLEESPNGWLLADAGGTIRFVNARLAQLFGYSRDELIGAPVELLIPENLRDLHLAHRKTYMERPATRPMGIGLELSARRKDGTEFPVEISLSPMTTPQGVYVTAILRDITERVILEEERENLRVELEMERERDRIGMDLHDGVMQEIYAAGLTLELALADLPDRPEGAAAEIERSIGQLHEVIRNIRSYIFDLRPREFAGTLGGALAELAREFRQNTQIEVTEEVSELDAAVERHCATAAYHIVHEALSNVRKHADASQVLLRVSETSEHVVIEVNDNGRGFDVSTELPQVHRGLRNMDARARSSGCELALESTPGTGTCVTLRVPIAD